ncbi:MAG: hypothetical protein IK031_03520 [Bacteroidales bacterium]|nr:hypothetical protein [Bacteroidales bacterium]
MRSSLRITAAFAAIAALCSCMQTADIDVPLDGTRQVGFDISVTREGEAIEQGRHGIHTRSTDGSYDSGNMISTMDEDIPFGLVGIDFDHHAVVVDNAKVSSDGYGYNAGLGTMYWEDLRSEIITFSAYYPYVQSIDYGDDCEQYSIPYTVKEADAGPLVSKTVEVAVARMNMIPLEFQHITNDIGYRICDITPDESLQGLIHLRKVVAHKVASAGVFVNDLNLNRGLWRLQGYYRNLVIFDGDAKVGVGSSNEKFVGFSTLEDRMADSHRYYSIPDEIKMGRQYVEVVFDVEGFTLNGFPYPPIEGVTLRYPLYGLLPDNVFVYGRQYTFHIGIDLSSVYSEITFSPTVQGWETKIYEDNEDF